ncbi:MAG: hypothetical protein Pars93KO_25520 [Parasphingorhabdus sp.]
MLKRGGTRLSTIPNHTLWVWCACGHHAGVEVARILDRENPPETVGQTVQAMRCSSCRSQSIKDYRITYEGGSWGALEGADNRAPGPKPSGK